MGPLRMDRVCEKLHLMFDTIEKNQFPFEKKSIPRNGIYILFESTESGHGRDRIVRIGTHTGEGKLCSRLQEHFTKEKKDRSIFRKNVGRALLNEKNDDFIYHWNLNLTSRSNKMKFGKLIDSEKQKQVEREVSEIIQKRFRFIVIPIDDKMERLSFERKLISTVSNCDNCGPSKNWLGLNSPIVKIQESGLWQVQGLYGQGLTLEELYILNEKIYSEY